MENAATRPIYFLKIPAYICKLLIVSEECPSKGVNFLRMSSIDRLAHFRVILWKSASVKEIVGNHLSPILMTKMFVSDVDTHQATCLDPLNLNLERDLLLQLMKLDIF